MSRSSSEQHPSSCAHDINRWVYGPMVSPNKYVIDTWPSVAG